ncbi:unnamed protein product [Amoebophrya sp. A25]|nr:unnamed protein product [Amoebophrya sp. A25]|eukprot:GSA25T00003956001.1
MARGRGKKMVEAIAGQVVPSTSTASSAGPPSSGVASVPASGASAPASGAKNVAAPSSSSSATTKNQNHYDLIVIGAGSGGLAAAKRAAQKFNKRVMIVENAYIGGTCVTVGCVPKKMLHTAAEFKHKCLQAERMGWCGATNESLHSSVHMKFSETMKNVRAYVARLNGIHKTNLDKAGVEVVRGTAFFTGPNDISVKTWHGQSDLDGDGGNNGKKKGQNQNKDSKVETEAVDAWTPLSHDSRAVYAVMNHGPQLPLHVGNYTAERIIVATGSSASRMPQPGSDLCSTSLEFFADWERLPKTCCIFGGGYIAVELAGILNAFGCEVDIVIRRDVVLRGFDDELRSHLQGELIKRGVNIKINTEPEKFEELKQQTPFSTDDGKKFERKQFTAKSGRAKGQIRVTFKDKTEKVYDAVLQAVGRKANTSGLGCEAGSIALSPEGAVSIHTYADVHNSMVNKPQPSADGTEPVSTTANDGKDGKGKGRKGKGKGKKGKGKGKNAEGTESSAAVPGAESSQQQITLYQSKSNPSVFALGDVNDLIQLTPVAIAQGRQLIDMLYGKGDFAITERSFQMYSSAIFALPECGVCGLTEEQAITQFGKKNVVIKKPVFPPLQQWALKPEEKEVAFLKLVFKKSRRSPGNADAMQLVGAHICTEAAAEIVQSLGIAMQKGITKRDLDLTMALHPSVMEEIVTLY